jgi:hypothetical protein
MLAEPEFKRSERIGHESIIKIEDGLTLSPYYAVSYNISETGMQSLSEMYPGADILIKIDDYAKSENQVPAKVVWCKKLENASRFHYGVGVQFFQSEKNFCLKAPLQIAPQMTTLDMKKGGVVIKMEKRLSE